MQRPPWTPPKVNIGALTDDTDRFEAAPALAGAAFDCRSGHRLAAAFDQFTVPADLLINHAAVRSMTSCPRRGGGGAEAGGPSGRSDIARIHCLAVVLGVNN